MWQNSQKPNNNGNVSKNDVARPDRTARSSWSSSTSPHWGQTAFSSSPYQGRPATSFRAAQRPPAHTKEGLTQYGHSRPPSACGRRSRLPPSPGDTPGPLARVGLRPGPRLCRPAVHPPSRPRAAPLDLSEERGPGRVPGSAARPSLVLRPKGHLPLET